MATLNWPSKDPDEIIDYEISWTDRMSDTDEVTSFSFASTGGVTIDQSSVSADKRSTVAWISGGTEGEICIITGTANTLEGRKLQQSVRLKVKSR